MDDSGNNGVERGGEGSRGETDFERIGIAFGENRRGDMTGAGNRNKRRRKAVVRLVYGVR